MSTRQCILFMLSLAIFLFFTESGALAAGETMSADKVRTIRIKVVGEAGNKDRLKKWTNLFEGLDIAKQYPDGDHIFLLSDGQPTTGPESKEEARYRKKILNKLSIDPDFRKTRIVAIWVGGELNVKVRDFLRLVANDYPSSNPDFDTNRPRGKFIDKSE